LPKQVTKDISRFLPSRTFATGKCRGQYKNSREKVVKNFVKELHDSIGFFNRTAKCGFIASKKRMKYCSTG